MEEKYGSKKISRVFSIDINLGWKDKTILNENMRVIWRRGNKWVIICCNGGCWLKACSFLDGPSDSYSAYYCHKQTDDDIPNSLAIHKLVP